MHVQEQAGAERPAVRSPHVTGDRPRERLLRHGAAALSDSELLAILIGTGTRGKHVDTLAREVLSLFDGAGSSSSNGGCSRGRVSHGGASNGPVEVEKLLGIGGLGIAKSAALAAALEFARRLLYPASHRISQPADVVPLISHYADRKQEHFLCLSLNGAHEVAAIRVVSVGLVNRTVIHPREFFCDALVDRAAAVIAAHNHPSGNVEPSPEDRDVTERLKGAGETLGVRLLDHIVFGRRGYYSFLERGEL